MNKFVAGQRVNSLVYPDRVIEGTVVRTTDKGYFVFIRDDSGKIHRTAEPLTQPIKCHHGFHVCTWCEGAGK